MKSIYYNGIIKTMDSKNTQVQALVIEDGIIKDRGNNEDILKYNDLDTLLYDLCGHMMLPGFIDGHSHFVGFANSLSQCDLSKATCFNDIISLMRDFIKDNNIEKNQWVYGCNYDHNFLKENKHPTFKELDQISLEHPIVIIHASSHMGVINTKAMQIKGLTFDIHDPIGGKYGREHNQLTGYMEENAFIELQKSLPMISIDYLLDLMIKAQDIYASYGITTLQEGAVTHELWHILEYANKNNLLKLDVVAYIDLLKCRDLLLNKKNYTDKYINHLKIGGYKIFLDGSPQGKTAFLSLPYKGSKDYCGYPTLTDEQVLNLYKQAQDDQQQLLAHCNGDGACEQFLRANEILGNGKRPVMIHAQLITKEQLKRMSHTNMMPSFFVSHTYYWGDIHIQNLGYERAKNISPIKSAINNHIPFTIHQDSPVLQPDMIEAMNCAMNRITRNGVLLNQEECITQEEALRALTINGAYQYYEEASKGSIEINKRADLVIIDHHWQILETIKDGISIYKKNQD